MLESALGVPPFPWQLRLLEHLISGRCARALDLPTGLGKTSVMAVWLVARALGAPSLPRRLVYVVDRRAVVDQATTEAMRLRDWVAQREDVAAELGLGDRPLPVSTLRGQFLDNREWLEHPAKPAIVVGTVDMIGSRVLFEGYGCSRKMRPYHAGMLGIDTWFVVDESHLVPPFERMLEQLTTCSTLGGIDSQPTRLPPRARLLSLSATGRHHGGDVFRLEGEDRVHPVVALRLGARKDLLVEQMPAGAKLPPTLAARAFDLAQRAGAPARVVVFSSSREVAENAKAALLQAYRTERGPKAPLPDAELLVGARRLRERSLAERRLRSLGFLAGSARPRDHAFLFATSAGEVGVDLDADHLVGDVVAWERIVQRLGRVNRRGEGAAQVVLIATDEWPDVEQPVLDLLARLPVSDAGSGHDASPAALSALRESFPADVIAASTREPLHPALSRPLVDSWSMTSLREHTGRPEVSPWLRGWVEDPPQTALVWRTTFPPQPTDEVLAAFFEAAPPHASETLETGTHRVVEWLFARTTRLEKAIEKSVNRGPDPLLVVVLDAADEFVSTWRLSTLKLWRDRRWKDRLIRELAGRTLVVHDQVAGLSADGLLDDSRDEPPLCADGSPDAWAEDEAAPIPFRISWAIEPEPLLADGWRERIRFPEEADDDESVARWLVVQRRAGEVGSEDGRSAGNWQTLAEHQAWTAKEMDEISAALELADDLRRVLRIAARLHDEGKRAARWQRAFRARPNDVYAKTPGPLNPHLLDGYRHELGSLPLAQADPEFRALDPQAQDLVLHLIAAHHGFARPWIETRSCEDLPPSAIEQRAQEVALRFVALQERFGPWGLPWLETLVRAADQRASRANEQRSSR